MAIYGLLIGINQYKNTGINPLNGCVHDVDLFAQTLQEKFAVKEGDLKTLTNTEATYQNIVAQFQTHLIKREWQKDDVAVFYFSGHGAQTAAPAAFWDIEANHLNESLVCHDSRTEGVHDLLDKELRYLIAKLAKRCQQISIFLDCCHGGHGTRVSDNEQEASRFASADMLQYPINSFVFSQHCDASANHNRAVLKQLIPASGKHFLLSGCQDFQLSRENVQGINNKIHGYFTFALCEIVSKLQYPISYRELRNRVHTRVQQLNPSQSPQLDAIAGANEKQTLLGGKILPLKMLVYKQANQWKLNVGAIQGFNSGDELALFNDDSKTQSLNHRLTTAYITQVNSRDSVLNVKKEWLLTENEYAAVVSNQQVEKMPITLVGEQQEIAIARKYLDQDAAGRFLIEATETAQYVIYFERNTSYLTQVGDTRPLFKKNLTIQATLEQAAAMARWQQKLNLDNPVSKLTDNPVEVIINYEGKVYKDEAVSCHYRFNGTTWINPQITLELRLKTHSSKPLYCAVLYFDSSTGGISNALIAGNWLSNQGSPIEGQINRQTVVKVREGRPITLNINDKLFQQGITQVQDYLKLIVCEGEFESSLLTQQDLTLFKGDKMASQQTRGVNSTLRTLIYKAHYRPKEKENKASEALDWTSKVINLAIIRPQAFVHVSDTSQLLFDSAQIKITLKPHPVFRGQIRLSATQSNLDNKFMFSLGRGNDLGLDALEININSDAFSSVITHDAVSTDHPLRLLIQYKMPNNTPIIPYTYNQKQGDILPLGYASAISENELYIYIESLPETNFIYFVKVPE